MGGCGPRMSKTCLTKWPTDGTLARLPQVGQETGPWFSKRTGFDTRWRVLARWQVSRPTWVDLASESRLSSADCHGWNCSAWATLKLSDPAARLGNPFDEFPDGGGSPVQLRPQSGILRCRLPCITKRTPGTVSSPAPAPAHDLRCHSFANNSTAVPICRLTPDTCNCKWMNRHLTS